MTAKRHHLGTVGSLYKHLPGPAAHMLIIGCRCWWRDLALMIAHDREWRPRLVVNYTVAFLFSFMVGLGTATFYCSKIGTTVQVISKQVLNVSGAGVPTQ